MISKQKQIGCYRAGNVEAARIITSDPVKYPPGRLPAVLAAMVLKTGGRANCAVNQGGSVSNGLKSNNFSGEGVRRKPRKRTSRASPQSRCPLSVKD